VLLFLAGVGFAACTEKKKQSSLHFETVNDSLYKPDDNYKQGLAIWKQYYEHCMNQPLFADAFFLQLQDKINIGSINNAQATDITRGLKILDTANNQNLFHLLAIMNSANCSDTIQLSSHLRKDFYSEITKLLNAPGGYNSLVASLDSTQLSVRAGAIYYDALRPDTLINMLNRSSDSSLIQYKELLLAPENVLLAQTVDMIGFSAELPLKVKLASELDIQLKKGISYNLNSSNDKINIVLLPNNKLRMQINKRYTVLGKFLKLKAE
jgi:hypothetical protein